MKIILIRHGKPMIKRGRLIGWSRYRDFYADYDRAGLDPKSAPRAPLATLLKELDHAYTSHRPRSIESAQKLLPDVQRIENPVFDEAPLLPPKVPLVRRPASWWMVLARAAWHMGYHGGGESWMVCKRRAMEAMEILWRDAERHGTSVLVAHGYINLMIGIRLKKRGWKRTGRHSYQYWNAVVYERDQAALPAPAQSAATR